MRAVVWLVVLFAAATALALFMGGNDAIVTLFWAPWRLDVSLNVFILGLIVLGLALYVLLRGLDTLLSLPERARLWRAQRRDVQANTLLQDAMLHLLAGRYSRSQKAASAAVAALRGGDSPSGQRLLEPLAWWVRAESAHRLQDRAGRDAAALAARDAARRHKVRQLDEAADLRAAAWLLDDRRAPEALQQLETLPPGVARRTVALRMKLKAARLVGDVTQALHTARLLDKHQGFGARGSASGQALLRRLAQDSLAGARDRVQLQRLWQALEESERQDPYVAAHAATRFVAFDDAAAARQCLIAVWTGLFDAARDGKPVSASALGARSDEVQAREVVLRAVVAARSGADTGWLARLEAAAAAYPREAAPAWAAGMAFEAAGLWGKARQMLQQALRPVASASGGSLSAPDAALAWQALGQMAERDGDTAAALVAFKHAAALRTA